MQAASLQTLLSMQGNRPFWWRTLPTWMCPIEPQHVRNRVVSDRRPFPAWSAQLWFYHFSATNMFIQRQTYTGSKRFKPNLQTSLWVRLGTLNRRSPRDLAVCHVYLRVKARRVARMGTFLSEPPSQSPRSCGFKRISEQLQT